MIVVEMPEVEVDEVEGVDFMHFGNKRQKVNVLKILLSFNYS